jgi:O-antigen/teichoic acid export membrane protein
MTSSDRFILAALSDQAEVGLYDMAAKLSSVVLMATMAFQQAWSPFAYSILGEKGAERVYAKVLDVYALVGCAIATAVVLFGPLLFHVLTTEPFYPAVTCLPFLVFAHFFSGAHFIAGLGSGIAKRSLPLAGSIGIGAVVNVGLNFALIPLWGRDGAAAATLAAYAVTTLYLFVTSQRQHTIPYRWSVLLGCLATSAAVIFVAWTCTAALTLTGLALRTAMLLAFVPVGYWLAGIRWAHLRPSGVRGDSEP